MQNRTYDSAQKAHQESLAVGKLAPYEFILEKRQCDAEPNKRDEIKYREEV